MVAGVTVIVPLKQVGKIQQYRHQRHESGSCIEQFIFGDFIVKHEAFVSSGRTVVTDLNVWTDGATFKYNRFYFSLTKRLMDFAFALLCLPFLLILTVLICVANPFWNPGKVFFRQRRMGRHGKAFTMWKFRTMADNGAAVRDANAPLDADRITSLGRLLRRSKLDELPNIFNILTGDMSLVGPRPDAFEHATEYALSVPRYRKRFTVRPGITGLAQVRGGYADNLRSVRRKARYDSYYIRHRSILFEFSIIGATIGVVLSGFGQR
ncbi:sugar transferase [Sulfitobacter sp. F26169L]|uniref:sugar transferase n=1 Tax=Sulfitobacter sp. F26169L TaxID=2996015 RepID=UPI002260EE88|nr:sugar transferase [Sulfitobacter sp. F26169L]MCX7567508.1 sugar transferase [Sulfitobacter sp. F26169L]